MKPAQQTLRFVAQVVGLVAMGAVWPIANAYNFWVGMAVLFVVKQVLSFGYGPRAATRPRGETSDHHVEVTFDTAEAEAKLDRLAAKVERVEAAMRDLNGPS